MDYDYSEQIHSAKEITIFVLYAHTWMNRYLVDIKSRLGRKHCKLTICVPAFDNAFIAPLAERFGCSPDHIKRKIAEAVSGIVSAAKYTPLGTGSQIRIFCHTARPSYSLYRFDDSLLVGPYYASGVRTRAPMFEFLDIENSMFKEFSEDVDSVLEKESVLVFDTNAKSPVNRVEAVLGEFLPSKSTVSAGTASPVEKPNEQPETSP